MCSGPFRLVIYRGKNKINDHWLNYELFIWVISTGFAHKSFIRIHIKHKQKYGLRYKNCGGKVMCLMSLVTEV